MSSQGHKRSLGRQTNRTRFWGRRRVRLGANQQRVTVTSGGNVSGLFGRLLGSRTFKTSFVWLISTFPDLFSFRRQHRIVDSEYRDIVAVSHRSIFHNGIAAAGRQRFASRSRFLLPGECLGPSGASLCRHAPEAVTAHCHANCSFWCEGVHITPRIHLASVLLLRLIRVEGCDFAERAFIPKRLV